MAQPAPRTPDPRATESTDIGGIIVTAQRRSDRLQNVPQAVTAFGAESLQQLGIRDTESLARNTPSLTFTPVGPGESNVGLRGLTTDLGLAPSVAVYINDTPFDFRTDAYSGTPNVDLFDMDRIEVLRGPQGTLFGSSSTGGTIRYITKQPDPSQMTFHGEAGVNSTDSGGMGYVGKGAVNLPLSDRAALRIVGAYEHFGGYIDQYRATSANLTLPQSTDTRIDKNVNSADVYGVRAALRLEPASGLTLTPSLFFQRFDGDNPIITQTNLPRYGQATAIGDQPSRTDLFVANLPIEKDLGFASVVSSTSFLHKRSDATLDYTPLDYNAFGEFLPLASFTPTKADTFTQEIRLTSSNTGPFNWITGVYYSHTKQSLGQIFVGQDLADYLVTNFGSVPGPVDATAYRYLQKTSDEQIAAFAELNYKLTDEIELIGGARVYRLKNTLRASCSETVQGILCGSDTPLTTAKKTDVSPRFTIKYKPAPNATFYATASRGFRAGGANAQPPAALDCALAASASALFRPDSVWNYEAGAKYESPNRLVTMNGAVFRIDQKGVQISIPDPCGIQFFANAGDARIKGAELEMSLRPTSFLTFGAQASYNDGKFTKVPAAFGAAAGYAVGDRTPETPRWKFGASAELEQPLTGTWNGYLRSDWQHVGKTPFAIDGLVSSGRFRPAYDLVNFQVGAKNARYEVALFMRNAFNERGVTSISSSAVTNVPGVFENVAYVTPRTIGVTLRLKD
jgi:outer membrane receptor protein involved in Fe transport